MSNSLFSRYSLDSNDQLNDKLGDQLEVDLFKKIYSQRALRRDQLFESQLGHQPEAIPPDERKPVDDAISKLVNRRLVQIVPGVVNDFDNILVTAEGFRLANLVKL